MLLDWKNQYCQNDYTTQGNLEIQCNPYQITNGILHRIRKNILKFVWKQKKKNPNSQNNIEKKKQNWKNQAP